MNQPARYAPAGIEGAEPPSTALSPPRASYIVDAAGVVLACTADADDAAADAVGRPLAALLPAAAVTTCADALQAVAADGEARHLTLAATAAGGAARVVEITPLRGLATGAVLVSIAPVAVSDEPPLLELAEVEAHMGWFEREIGAARGRCSAAFAALLGIPWDAGRYAASDVAARVHADDGALHDAFAGGADPGALANPDGVAVTFRIEHPQRGLRHIEARYRLVERSGHRHLHGVAIDVTEREQTARELARSQARLESVMRKAHVAPFEWDLRRDELSGPPSLARIFHVDETRSSWPTAAFVDAIHPDDRASVQHVFEHPPAAGETNSLEYRVRLPGDRYATIEARYTSVADDDGAVSLVRGVVIDVSDRAALDAQRCEAEERFATLSRLVPGVLYQFRRAPDGHMAFHYTSHAVTALLGISRSAAETSFDNILSIVHRDDVRRLSSSIEHSALTLSPWREDVRIHHPDGRVHWIMGHATPLREADGSIVWNGYLADITAQKEAEQALVESAAHLNLALSYAGMIPWYWDAHSDEVKSISAVRPEYRAADGKIYMRRFMAMIHDADREQVMGTFRAKISAPDGEEIRVAYRAQLPGMESRWYEITARARIEGGRVLGFYGITADIDARRRGELEQEALRAQLLQAQKMESIGLLTGGIAHDFNNVIAAILGYSGLALRRYGSEVEPRLLGYLHEVQHAGERARDMVQQLMAFGRAQASTAQPVDVAHTIEESLRLLRPMLPSTLTLEVDVGPRLPAALADPVQLQQVLVNLCINARDATGERGHVRIEAGYRGATRGHCASCHTDFDGDYVCITVVDDGPGIDEATRDRLFEPFYSTKPQGAGAGMGLAMCHGIVHAHHGHLRVDSAAGLGARFEVLLPAVTLPAEAKPVTPATDAPARRRVLVVDDEAAVATFLGELLGLEGYAVTTMTEARLALERFSADPDAFDAVITDQTMPGLTGYELARAMLRLRPALPIILVSGYSATIDERDALAAGIKAYLPKPIDDGPLVELLGRLCA
ncbi:MAG: PAS domain-containing protein [Gammaproteobacteria bacterium]|nr:PAS domain-containing protein [Gammaproteobacteria bacterium]